MKASGHLESCRRNEPIFNPDALERAILEEPTDVDNPGGVRTYGSMSVVKQPKVTKEKDQVEFISEQDRLFGGSVGGRYPCLDVTRIWCVCMVCVDHGGTSFGIWNVMFVQGWVLQYLYLICGICFGMTSKPIAGFAGRLALYFMVGVTCNWTAFVYLGREWRHEIFNVVFQFWFIVALVLFLIILAPLKSYLRAVQRDQCSNQGRDLESVGTINGILIIAAGFTITAVVFNCVVVPVLQALFAGPIVALVNSRLGSAAIFWGLPTTVKDGRDWIEAGLSCLELSMTNLYLVIIFPFLSPKVAHVGWLVLLNTYLHKMILYRGQVARVVTCFDFAMLGLVCYHYGLSYREQVGKYITRYWFVVLFLCALLWPPGTNGRFDENPPKEMLPRAMDNALEGICALMFLTALERAVDHAIFTEDCLDFLSDWALLCFLVHKAVHMCIPSPFNWAFLGLLVVPSYILRRYLSGKTERTK